MTYFRSSLALFMAMLLFGSSRPCTADEPAFEIEAGKKVAFVGNSLAERMNLFGHFETRLQIRFAESKPVFRNFGWPADAVEQQARPGNYTKIDDPFLVYSPEVLVCFFGFNESFAGTTQQELAAFRANYEKYLASISKKITDAGGKQPSFALVSPIAFEATGNQFQPDGQQENANLAAYTEVVRELAVERKLPFVDLFTPTKELFAAEPGAQYTINGCHLNEAGDKAVAELLDKGLFGDAVSADDQLFEKVRTVVNDKAWLHLQDYRMLNGWYVYGGRRTWDTETFPGEFVKIRSMVSIRDDYINDLVLGKPVPDRPDDSTTGDVFIPETMFGSRDDDFREFREPKTLKYPTPEESISQMTVPDGFEVQVFASEKDFPELANPTQIAFDSKGRLWVSCMINYPQWLPNSSRPSDRLLILEDTDGDGKADKCTNFYDKLICPTGFEFHKDGVLVVDEPRILFLQDTDGDDKADKVTHMLDGIGTSDTHHAMGAWEWSQGGRLHMLEGIAMSTTMETPWGPKRQIGASGCYFWDLESLKMGYFRVPGTYNPWCLVFNKDGYGVVGDGTNSNQYWTSPFSGGQPKTRSGIDPIFNNEGMRPSCGNEFLETRQFPEAYHDKLIYSCVINMHGFPSFVVNDSDENVTGLTGRRVEDLISSTDMFFRPVDPKIGPDGALWFGDWCNALIGHMQYSQRDPNRDHEHGRIYRLVHKDTPLLEPVTQYGKSNEELLQQLLAFEPRTRYRARRELVGREREAVLSSVSKWVSEADSPEAWVEGLWVQETLHGVDADLVAKILAKGDFKQRSAAMHVVGNEIEYLSDAESLLEQGVADANGRVRLETIRATSLNPTIENARIALLSLASNTDKWIDYTLEHAIRSFEPVLLTDEGMEMVESLPEAARDHLELSRIAQGPGAQVFKPMKVLADVDAKQEDLDKALQQVVAAQKGNRKNGSAVFKRVCANCHQNGNLGVKFGPDLTGLGDRMNKDHIVRSILWPNEEISKGYETIMVADLDGVVTSGFVLEETDEKVVLGIADGKKKEILKEDIEERKDMKASSMPEGLTETISPGEFVDLLAFLMGDWVATNPNLDYKRQSYNGQKEVSRQTHIRIPQSFPPQWNIEAEHLLSHEGVRRSSFAFHSPNSEQTPSPEVIIRFNEPTIVRTVKVVNRNDADLHDRAKGLTFSVSADGEEWKEIWTARNAYPNWEFTTKHDEPIKYAKFSLKGAGILHLYKAFFYGEVVK
ncbi:PVC-type heme-binding CxxCH protein [Mariniblastus fucicola]|uniref:Cytochrome c n=1 Tax=Mariniblastus fucicola TaxID=980251 RepID=A0A5B9P5L2_9BACT|nr:PVC-type heme-binding CxxCH protein [Mariniblastus fucicola]QEG20210.1 Cytochrome c [Mariniblastus fucicola]